MRFTDHEMARRCATRRFNRARIPDLARFNPYLPNDKLRFDGGSGTLTGDLRVDGDSDQPKALRGRLLRLSWYDPWRKGDGDHRGPSDDVGIHA